MHAIALEIGDFGGSTNSSDFMRNLYYKFAQKKYFFIKFSTWVFKAKINFKFLVFGCRFSISPSQISGTIGTYKMQLFEPLNCA